MYDCGSMFNRDAVRYAFGRLIQEELLQFTSEWMAEVPGGIPEVLYHMPHLNGQLIVLAIVTFVIILF